MYTNYTATISINYTTIGYRNAKKKTLKHLSCIVQSSTQQRWSVLYDQRPQ